MYSDIEYVQNRVLNAWKHKLDRKKNQMKWKGKYRR